MCDARPLKDNPPGPRYELLHDHPELGLTKGTTFTDIEEVPKNVAVIIRGPDRS